MPIRRSNGEIVDQNNLSYLNYFHLFISIRKYGANIYVECFTIEKLCGKTNYDQELTKAESS